MIHTGLRSLQGALGRCGRGAVDLFEKIGVPSENIVQVRGSTCMMEPSLIALQWDMAETSAKPGPYDEIIESDM